MNARKELIRFMSSVGFNETEKQYLLSLQTTDNGRAILRDRIANMNIGGLSNDADRHIERIVNGEPDVPLSFYWIRRKELLNEMELFLALKNSLDYEAIGCPTLNTEITDCVGGKKNQEICFSESFLDNNEAARLAVFGENGYRFLAYRNDSKTVLRDSAGNTYLSLSKWIEHKNGTLQREPLHVGVHTRSDRHGNILIEYPFDRELEEIRTYKMWILKQEGHALNEKNGFNHLSSLKNIDVYNGLIALEEKVWNEHTTASEVSSALSDYREDMFADYNENVMRYKEIVDSFVGRFTDTSEKIFAFLADLGSTIQAASSLSDLINYGRDVSALDAAFNLLHMQIYEPKKICSGLVDVMKCGTGEQIVCSAKNHLYSIGNLEGASDLIRFAEQYQRMTLPASFPDINGFNGLLCLKEMTRTVNIIEREFKIPLLLDPNADATALLEQLKYKYKDYVPVAAFVKEAYSAA